MASIRPQEASSSMSPCSYHVFLSFRGEDTRKTFTNHLYTALDYAGFRTFRDDDGIERGENIKLELQKAIQESKISIVVLSKNYASSSWCLDELVMILKRRSTSGLAVFPIFYDVDPSHVRKQTGSFEEAFTRYEGKTDAISAERRNEWISKLEEWKAALIEVSDLAGMNLQNQADGHESRFIQQIIKVVGDKLSRRILDVAPYPIGIHSRAREIQFWLDDGSADVGIVALCGMGGIGKTTISKFLYNMNFSRFEGSSFLANVREVSKQQGGLLRLQRQLVSDILKGRKEMISNIDEGIVKIKDAFSFKRVLVVLDDVDKLDQLHALLGMHDWLFAGSKIIITTRHEHLLMTHEVCKVHRIKSLDYNESLELFSLHTFGQIRPIDDYADVSKLVVKHCGGLPLAVKVLGCSLSGKSLGVWKSLLEKLKAIPNREILEKLKISYDSLQDNHDKNLFLYLACFFVGKDKDCTIAILDRCEFYTLVGIQNLVDRCLVTIDEHNTLVMHQLLQAMGREIAREESTKKPGECSILWNHKDSFNVLRENTGTNKIEGLVLNMHILKEDESVRTAFGVCRKRPYQEFLDKSLLSNLGNSLKRHCCSIFSSRMVAIVPENSDRAALQADTFARMCKLKILQLNHVHVSGPYENFPKGLRWLSWGGFPLKSIPREFPLENLVALDLHYSSLKSVWERSKFLPCLKILDLSHSYYLAKTPNFSGLPNLERLMLENCASLNEVHESIGHLERLVLLNLKDCKNLRTLPRSIGMLKLLEKLDISGCSNLDKLPVEVRNMVSLKVLHANATSILSTVGDENEIQSFIRHWLWKPKKSLETSWASFPWSLVKLSLRHCNLSNDAFPREISSLLSLNFLDLSCNPVRSLPDCFKDLNGLQNLYINNCCSLRRLLKLNNLAIGGNCLLEKITFPMASHRPKHIFYPGKINNLYDFRSFLKLQPIGNVNAHLLNDMRLSLLKSLRNPIMELTTVPSTGQMKFPLQGCQEAQIYCTFFPGSKVPPCFTFRSTRSLISFIVPSHLNSRIRGLSVCALYGRVLLNYENNVSTFAEFFIDTHITVSNTNKGLIWSHHPCVFGFPQAGENMIWLSFWKFENRMEAGDEINISVIGGKLFQVKEIGVHIVYEDQETTSTHIQSTSEEEKESHLLGVHGCVRMMKYWSGFH